MILQKCVPFLLLFATCQLSAQVRGKVESSSGEALSFSTLFIRSTGEGTTTGEDGNFVLPVTVDSCWVIASYLGYRTDSLFWRRGATLTFRLDPEETIVDEVVISGTMREVSKSNSPVLVEVFTPQFFRRNPAPNLFSALENINGVRPQINCNVCNSGDIHINGMEGPYTMILIDGMPIVSSLSSVYGLMGIPASLIERIEVVKGPASSLYGSEAVGGLINVITRNPSSAPTWMLDASTTSYGEHNLDLGRKLKAGRFTGYIGGNAFWFDRIHDINDDNFTDVTLQKRMSLFTKWRVKLSGKRDAALALRYVWEDRWGGELNWTPAFRGGDSLYGENIITRRVEAIGNYRFSASGAYNLSYSWIFHDQDAAYGTQLFLGRQQIGFVQLTRAASWRSHQLLLGTTLRYTWYDDNTPVTAYGQIPEVNKPDRTWLPGIFLQDEITLGRGQQLLLGVRYDYNSNHGSIFSPRVNYKWNAGDRHIFRIGVGNGFRIANVFSEDHAALTGAREVIIAGDLKPERSWNLNVNHSVRFTPEVGIVNLDGSLFYTFFSNRIVADYFTDANKVIFDNLDGYGISRGATINASWVAENGMQLSAGGTLMEVHTREDVAGMGERIKEVQVQTPGFTGTWSVSVPVARWGLTIDYTGTVTSAMRLPIVPNDYRGEYSPWFSIQNIQFTKRFVQGWELYGGIKNLLNFIPEDPILRPFDPFDKRIDEDNPLGYTFDPNYNYAPMQGLRGFVGVRKEWK
jgi:outer membrane receptor for ferrienterochelin and colicins